MQKVKYEFAHSGITVYNLETSIEFYTKNFGFEEIKKDDKPGLELKLAILQLNNSQLELIQHYKPKINPMMSEHEKSSLTTLLQKSHIALITNDLPRAYNELKNKGIEVRVFEKIFFCFDPDEFPTEIKQK